LTGPGQGASGNQHNATLDNRGGDAGRTSRAGHLGSVAGGGRMTADEASHIARRSEGRRRAPKPTARPANGAIAA